MLLNSPFFLPIQKVKERLSICESCSQRIEVRMFITNTTVWKCASCGCILSFKARVTQAKCPLGKWS